jgi:hypothetical protein
LNEQLGNIAVKKAVSEGTPFSDGTLVLKAKGKYFLSLR